MNPVDLVMANPVVAWVIRIVGLSILAGSATAAVGFVYRSRFRGRFPDSAALIVGLGVVAFYLNTRMLLVAVVVENGTIVGVGTAVGNLAVFVTAGAASLGGRTAGDRIGGSDRFRWAGMAPTWSPLVRASGRFITVTLPDEIADIEGYDPVSTDAKARLAERSLEFPRGLTVDELERELGDRLKAKHDIGYVDVDLRADGTVAYLALGQRPAGLGPTLPPGTAAAAIRADPPFSASPGDTVGIWDPSSGESVGTAEIRASVGGTVATVVCSRDIAEAIDSHQEYRLLTLPTDAHPHREFASILRRHDTTMGVIDVIADSPLVGTRIAEIEGTVIAVESDGDLQTIPGGDRPVAAGDRLFVLAPPESLRSLEAHRGVTTVTADTAMDAVGVNVADAVERARERAITADRGMGDDRV